MHFFRNQAFNVLGTSEVFDNLMIAPSKPFSVTYVCFTCVLGQEFSWHVVQVFVETELNVINFGLAINISCRFLFFKFPRASDFNN